MFGVNQTNNGRNFYLSLPLRKDGLNVSKNYETVSENYETVKNKIKNIK